MTEVREFLEEKAALGDREWLRSGRTTHPRIIELVREYREIGYGTDDEAERFVEAEVGDLPTHRHHGDPHRHPLTIQLGHEVYLAKGILRDEELAEEEQRALAAGFVRLEDLDGLAIDGTTRYTVRFGTQYVGQNQISWGREHPVRVVVESGRIGVIPKGARNPRYVSGPVLIREGWS